LGLKNLSMKRTVLIIGASFSGLTCAHLLHGDFDVTVIEKRRFFEYTPGILRALVEPAHIESVVSPVNVPGIKIVFAKVIAMTNKAVFLESGDKMKFDYLIVASGSEYPDPIKPQDNERDLETRKQNLRKTAEHIKDAKEVLLVGGGIVGVELAAEIAWKYPQKSIILRTRGERLLKGLPQSCADYAEKWLQKHGVIVHTKSPVMPCPPGAQHEHGSKLVLACTGLRRSADNIASVSSSPQLRSRRKLGPDSEEKQQSDGRKIPELSLGATECPKQPNPVELEDGETEILIEKYLDEFNRIRVNKFLCLDDFPAVFVVGDAAQVNSDRHLETAYTAEVHAMLVSKNIHRLNQNLTQLPYPEGVTGTPNAPRVVCVSLGKYDGLLIFNSLVIGGKSAALAKWFIEITKIDQYNGGWVGNLMYKIADPLTFGANRIWQGVGRLFGRSPT